MFDYKKLLGKMKECGYTQEQIAMAIGISTKALNMKLKNKSDFRQDEILSISRELEIHNGEIGVFFFTELSDKP